MKILSKAANDVRNGEIHSQDRFPMARHYHLTIANYPCKAASFNAAKREAKFPIPSRKKSRFVLALREAFSYFFHKNSTVCVAQSFFLRGQKAVHLASRLSTEIQLRFFFYLEEGPEKRFFLVNTKPLCSLEAIRREMCNNKKPFVLNSPFFFHSPPSISSEMRFIYLPRTRRL